MSACFQVQLQQSKELVAMAMRPDLVAVGSQCHVALLDPRCCDVVSVVEGQKAREVSGASNFMLSIKQLMCLPDSSAVEQASALVWGGKQSPLLRKPSML